MNHVDIYKREDGKWAWRLVHENGNVLATDGGQGYERKADAFDVAHKTVTGRYFPDGIGSASFRTEGVDF